MGLFDESIQNAIDTVWNNTIGAVTSIIPSWFTQPYEVWVAAFLGLAVGYVLGRWGIVALAIVGGALIFVFTLGKRQK